MSEEEAPPAPPQTKAGLSFGQEEQDATQRLGRAILTLLARCFKLTTMHALANEALSEPITSLVRDVNILIAEHDAAALQLIEENIFLNREIVKQDSASFESGQTLRAIFERLKINEITFRETISENDIRQFLGAFQEGWHGKDVDKLKARNFPRIALREIQAAQGDALGAEIDERQNVVRTYALLLMGLNESLEQAKQGRPPRMGRIRRAVQGLAEAAMGHESLLIGLTRFPNLSGDATYHAASVAALTLLMGMRLGLGRKPLIDLGMAALYHDIGRADLADPFEGQEAESAAGDEDEDDDLSLEEYEPPDGTQAQAESIRRIPLRSVLHISTGRISQDSLARAAVAFEHTLPVGGELSPSAAARLIAVPCAFDLLTSPPPPRRGLPPDQVLRIVLDKAGTRFDEQAARLFAAVVGLYPVGTTVKLSGGQTAIVTEVPSDPANFARPVVKVIREAAGMPADYLLDLARPDNQLTITDSVDPIDEDINVPHFLLA